MARAIFTIDDNDMLTIQQRIKEFQGDAEKTINDFLMNEASETFKTSIINFIPVSKAKKRKHAKTSDPLEHKQERNLELIIKTKTKYNYLYFPQNAEGTSKHNAPNDFVQKGVDREYDNVINSLLDKLQNNF